MMAPLESQSKLGQECERRVEDARRARVSELVESAPFWMCVLFLTLLDLALFSWQILPETSSATRDALRAAELTISTLFLGELALRCYAQDRERLLWPPNVFDTVIILCAFVLQIVEVSTPLLAARAARLVHCGASSARCGRAASKSQRSSVEMRALAAARRRGAGGFGKVAQRNSEAGITPLFVDLRSSDVLCAALADLSGAKRLIKGLGTGSLDATETRQKGADEARAPLMSCAALLGDAGRVPRSVREELDKASALASTHRSKLAARHDAIADATPRLKDDLEAPVKAQQHHAQTSLKALIALCDFALCDAKTRGETTPRLATMLRGGRSGLVFLKTPL